MPSIDQDPLPDGSVATLAIFAPDAADPCASVLPFPSDLAKNPLTGRLDLPYCTTDSADEVAIKTGLRTLDGYSVHTAVYTDFTRQLDAATISSGVRFFSASGAPVPFVAAQLPNGAGGYRLYLTPSAPLEAATKYVVVVTTALRDLDGNAVINDTAFAFVKSESPLIDRFNHSVYAVLDDASANGLEQVRLGFAPLFTSLGALGITRQSIAVAWAFTTQTLYGTMQQLDALAGTPTTVEHDNVAGANGNPLLTAAGIPTSALCSLHTGRIMLTSFATPSGTFGVQDGLPFSETVPVDYMLATPGVGCPTFDEAPDATWSYANVAIFVHGLGRCKNDMLAIANTLASVGFATLALDGPRAGARVVDNLGDQDLDGCPDQGDIPELIALAGEDPNPFAVRDGLREWGLEVAQVADLVKKSPWLLVGAEEPDPFLGTRVGVVGHSWGGMAAALAGPLAADAINAMVLSASSADLGAIFEPLLAASVPAADLPATLAAFVWALEPGDPLYAVPSYPSTVADLPVLAQVLDGGDAALNGALVGALHGVATQTALADALDAAGRTVTTTEMTWDNGGTMEPICTDATGVVGAMLQPCVASTDPAYGAALAKTVALQTEVATFLTLGLLP